MTDDIQKCNVCGSPVLYGERHHMCGIAISEARNKLIKDCLDRIDATIIVDGESAIKFREAIRYRVADLVKQTGS